MYKKMVVLLDGSELAEMVFGYACELSGRMHLDIHLLHVCSPDQEALLPMRRAYIEQKTEQLCTDAEAVRKQYDSADTGDCISAHGHVVVGYPAEEILKFVDDNEIDLVMMSTHGSSGMKDWDLGSVAIKVIHSSRVPVWLVPAALRDEIVSDTLPNRPLVVPLSGSKESEAAIAHAAAILQQRGAASDSELVLLHVLEGSPVLVSRTAVDELETQRKDMKAYLENLAEPIRALGARVRTEVLLPGDPAGALILYLKDNPTQLLVMATRGKSRLSRTIFGSVAESIINMVKVTPLLLVPGED